MSVSADAITGGMPLETPKAPGLRPRGSRVLVAPKEVAQERGSGIFIPDSVQKRSNEGIVRRIGPGRQTEYGVVRPVEDLSVGDRVLFLRWNGFEVMVDGEILVSVDEEAIVAVAEGEAVVRLGRDGVVDH